MSEVAKNKQDPIAAPGPGTQLSQVGKAFETLDHEALAQELVEFYESENKPQSLRDAGIVFKPFSKEEIDKDDKKQIGQIVVSADNKELGLPANTPLLIFSSNSVEAANIDPKPGFDMKRIKEIQQEHFINFLTVQANKANNNKDDDGNIQPITIQAIGFNLEELSQLVKKIQEPGNNNILQNIKIELPKIEECKCNPEEYNQMQQQIASLNNPSTQTASFGAADQKPGERPSVDKTPHVKPS